MQISGKWMEIVVFSPLTTNQSRCENIGTPKNKHINMGMNAWFSTAVSIVNQPLFKNMG